MDVVISSGWRSSSSTIAIDSFDEILTRPMVESRANTFVSKHGRFEITLTQIGSEWLVEYTSSGRLFGPRELIYSARHSNERHAAWDVGCRVIRATNNEQDGINAMREAAQWLRARRSVC